MNDNQNNQNLNSNMGNMGSNNNLNANMNGLNTNMNSNPNPVANPTNTGNPGQTDYYSNDSYYKNDNYSNNYSDTSYEEPEKKNSMWWKILLGVLALLIVIVVIMKLVGNKQTDDEKFSELKVKLCTAAESYVADNTELLGDSKAGTSATIKLQKLADANLIETKISNPYYSSSLFSKSTVDKYYSLDNSVRLTVLTDGTYNCEMVDNSADVSAPELRLSGDAEITIAVGTEFEDPGYTATDDYDGDVSSNVVRSGNVNTSVAGEYTITYTVTDSAGNVTTKTRKIVVEEYADIEITLGSILDKVTPMISLKGANPYCMVKGSNYIEPGAVATDNVDGDITGKIAITNKVTGNLMGSFRVVYKVEDAYGNQATAYRAVIVTTSCPEETNNDLVANTAPVITLVGKTAVTIQKGTQYLDLGATAYDKEDGDLTNKITTDTTAVNENSAGVYKVTYRVTDSSGTTSTAVRTVTVKESVSGQPSVSWTTSKSNISVAVGKGSDSLLAAPKAVDENKTAVTVTKKIEEYTTKVGVSSIDWNSVGKYRVTYTATHSNGTLKQTKSIVVTITAGGVSITWDRDLKVTKRSQNCDLTEVDLLTAGVNITANGTATPLVAITADDRMVCTIGSYEVTVSATVDNVNFTKETMTIAVVDGSSNLNTATPSKVTVTYNSAFSNDVYNTLAKWVGGATTGITLTFTATPAPNTAISYYEWSTDCNNVGGQASKISGTQGSLTWTTEGKNSVCIRAVTTAGSKGFWSDPVKLYLDKTGPKIEFTASTKSLGIEQNDWHNTPTMTIGYTATGESGGAGLDHFEYTYDDVRGLYGEKITNPTTYSEASGSLTVNENTESTRPSLFVYVRAVDKVGNIGEWTANPAFANIDTVKPNTPTLTVTGDTTSVVKLTAAFTDGTSIRPSGFGSLVYKENDGAEQIEKSLTITATPNTTQANITDNVKVWAVDKANNRSDGYAEKTVTVAPTKTLATGLTLKNGDTEISDGGNCNASTLYAQGTLTLTATPVPTDADDKIVSWVSDNTNVATIDENGKVTAKGPGTVNITAKIGTITKFCKLTVTKTTTLYTKACSSEGLYQDKNSCYNSEVKNCTAYDVNSCSTANSSGCYTKKCVKCGDNYILSSNGLTCTLKSLVPKACYCCGGSQGCTYTWTNNPGSNCSSAITSKTEAQCNGVNNSSGAGACYLCRSTNLLQSYSWSTTGEAPSSYCSLESGITSKSACSGTKAVIKPYCGGNKYSSQTSCVQNVISNCAKLTSSSCVTVDSDGCYRKSCETCASGYDKIDGLCVKSSYTCTHTAKIQSYDCRDLFINTSQPKYSGWTTTYTSKKSCNSLNCRTISNPLNVQSCSSSTMCVSSTRTYEGSVCGTGVHEGNYCVAYNRPSCGGWQTIRTNYTCNGLGGTNPDNSSTCTKTSDTMISGWACTKN